MISRALKLMLSGALVLLSGCAWLSDLPWIGSSKKLPALPEVKDSVVSLQWSASAGNPRLFMFTPALSDKLVYTAAANGNVSALAEQGGREVSRFDVKSKLTGAIGAVEDIVVVADAEGNAIALDATGRQRWKTPLEGEILAAPMVVQSSVIVRTADGRLFALNRADGKRRWVFTRQAPVLTLRTSAAVAVNRGVIYAGFPAGKVVAIELDTGRPVWEATISLPRGTTELERIADVAGVPVVDDSRVCAAVYQGRTGCVESLSGNNLWTRDISSADGVAVDAKNLYVSDTDGNVYGLDKTSGTTVWKQEKLAKRDIGTPVVVKGRVLVPDGLGMVHALSPETGELIGRAPTDGSRIFGLVTSTDRVFAQTQKGGVFAIAVR